MAISRKAIMLNMDAGLWVDVQFGQAKAITAPIAAKRYDNVAAFAAELPSVAWEPNQWGDQTKRLIDNVYGYRIRESYFTTPKIELEAYTDSPVSPAEINPAQNESTRTSVMYSYDNAGYLYVDPASSALPPDQKQYAFVSSHQQATRFSNLLAFEDLLNGSVLGDYPQGWGIQQYYFTKPVENAGAYNWFSGAAQLARDIERAFVVWSKEKGLYLYIDDIALPPASMTFSFVADPYVGTRFANLNDFDTIANATSLQNEIYGWEVPQFYFNRAVKPKPTDPFFDFWNVTPIPGIGLRNPGDVLPWLDAEAQKNIMIGNEFRSFVAKMNFFILTPENYGEFQNDFNNFWGTVDYGAYEQWLYDTYWKPNGGTL